MLVVSSGLPPTVCAALIELNQVKVSYGADASLRGEEAIRIAAEVNLQKQRVWIATDHRCPRVRPLKP